MRQRPSVLQHLADVTQIDQPAGFGARDVVLRLGGDLAVHALADDLAATDGWPAIRHQPPLHQRALVVADLLAPVWAPLLAGFASLRFATRLDWTAWSLWSLGA